jgi:hypothetical protein
VAAETRKISIQFLDWSTSLRGNQPHHQPKTSRHVEVSAGRTPDTAVLATRRKFEAMQPSILLNDKQPARRDRRRLYSIIRQSSTTTTASS